MGKIQQHKQEYCQNNYHHQNDDFWQFIMLKVSKAVFTIFIMDFLDSNRTRLFEDAFYWVPQNW